jgi:flagellar basal body-associated protein FliL
MLVRGVFVLAILASVIGWAGPAGAAAKEKQEPGSKNEIQARLSADYVLVPRLHMAVQVDANRKYRSLEVEVWLLQADPEKHQVLNSKKKQIAERMKEDFSMYNWEAFEDVAGGPEVAKRIVAQSVEQVSGTKVEDVLIKTLVLK